MVIANALGRPATTPSLGVKLSLSSGAIRPAAGALVSSRGASAEPSSNRSGVVDSTARASINSVPSALSIEGSSR